MQTEIITAKQIHEDFYGAEERLFVEAIGHSKGILNSQSNKAARLQKIGFGKAKPIKDAEEFHRKRGVSEKLISAIEYFRTYYPHYKFITEDEVKKLCGKYSLILGDTSNYTGDMPEKNLQDIEKFKLRKEDWKEKGSSYPFVWFDSPRRASEMDFIDEYGQINISRRQSGRTSDYGGLLDFYYQQMQAQIGAPKSRYATGVDPYKDESKNKKEVEKEQPAFKICAPKEDFDTRGYEIVDGHKLIYDPIVLQPVSKNEVNGYLIVTAWGDESTDELVVNQTQN